MELKLEERVVFIDYAKFKINSWEKNYPGGIEEGRRIYTSIRRSSDNRLIIIKLCIYCTSTGSPIRSSFKDL